jgi:hypothetical protein
MSGNLSTDGTVLKQVGNCGKSKLYFTNIEFDEFIQKKGVRKVKDIANTDKLQVCSKTTIFFGYLQAANDVCMVFRIIIISAKRHFRH